MLYIINCPGGFEMTLLRRRELPGSGQIFCLTDVAPELFSVDKMSTRLEREYLEANSIEELNHALLISAAMQGDMHSVRELVEMKQTDVNYINEVRL